MDGTIEELSRYRYLSGKEALNDAKLMYENGRYKNALNRAYYAIFHSIRSVIVLDGFDSSKHSGVIAHFNKNYVKEGLFPKELSKIIRLASEKREKADYLDFFIASKGEAKNQIDRATEFLAYIGDFLKENNIL